MSWAKRAPVGLRIFIVENHADTLECFALYLREMGHTVDDAASVAEALEKIPQSQCDVLLSDIGLPDGTGWDLLQKLQLPQPVYAIAMSGFGMSADKTRSKAVGFRHHLLKPVDPTDLDQLLEEAAAEITSRQGGG